MNVHPRQPVFSVTANHAEKLPAVSFVKSRVVGDEVERGDTLRLHVGHSQAEQTPSNPPAATVLLRVDRAYVGGEVSHVVKIVFDNAHAADYPLPVETEVPSVFGFPAEVVRHAGEIRIGGHSPFFVESLGGGVHELWLLAQCYVCVWHWCASFVGHI